MRVRAGATVSAEKSPTRLAVESRLKAWLLSRYDRSLFTLRFQDLAKIAKGEIGQADWHVPLEPFEASRTAEERFAPAKP